MLDVEGAEQQQEPAEHRAGDADRAWRDGEADGADQAGGDLDHRMPPVDRAGARDATAVADQEAGDRDQFDGPELAPAMVASGAAARDLPPCRPADRGGGE